MFIKRLKTEISHFKDLPLESQKILISYMLFSVSYPIIGIFVNAFLWRQSKDLTVVGFYNLCFGIGLCIGSYVNGLLLRKIKASYLYYLGCLLQGIIAFALIFFVSTNLFFILFYGTIYGIGSAFFWSNRHLFTLNFTDIKRRFYFNSLESSSDTIISIIMPFIIGWFIATSDKTNLYSTTDAYKISTFFALIFLSIAGLLVRGLSINVDKLKSVFFKNESQRWNLFRSIVFLRGISSGIFLFLPTLVILIFIGKEGALGTIQSSISLVTAIFVYYIGRKVGINNRFKVMFFGIVIVLTGASIFSFFYSSLAALIYICLNTFSNPLILTPSQNLYFETLEKEGQLKHHPYNYIFDQEVFLNLGRTFGIVIFLGIVQFLSQDSALRFTPLIVSLVQIPMLLLFRRIEKYNLL